jgi:hypothetical protein
VTQTPGLDVLWSAGPVGLADVLENGQASDDAILAQMQTVIAA